MGHLSAESEWDQFLRRSRPDVGFKQTTWWAEFLRSRGWGHFGVVVRAAGEIVGGARVLVQSFAPDKCYYYLPHGPVLPECEADAAEVFQCILADIDAQRRLDAQQVSHLRLEPRWERLPDFVRGFRKSSGWLEPRNTLCVELRPTADEILAQMKPKGRYNIRLALREGVSVVEDVSLQGVADFWQLYWDTTQRQHAQGHSSEYIHELSARLRSYDCGTIYFAVYQGLRLATALVIHSGDSATYKYGGSCQLHRNVMAPYLLHFEAMLKAKSRGHRWYDFYGISPAGEPENNWANFSAFKRKFGGQEIHFVPALDYVYDHDAYGAYRDRS